MCKKIYICLTMGYFKSNSNKEKRWICSCNRINGEDDKVCIFCKQPRTEKEPPKKTKSKAYDEIHLWPIFSLFIRLRDSNNQGIGNCFTCGKPKHYTKADCGHGAGRQHKATKYNEFNNHLQCKNCNGFEGGRREKYKEEMDKRYGPGTWDKMEIASRGISKLGKTEIDFLVGFYQKRVDELMKEKSLSAMSNPSSATVKH